jgi:hypothetical protein
MFYIAWFFRNIFVTLPGEGAMPSLIIVARTDPGGQTPSPGLAPLRIRSEDIIDSSEPGWWKRHVATEVTMQELESLPMPIVHKVMDHLGIHATTSSGKTGKPIKSDYLQSIHANWGKWFVPSAPDEDSHAMIATPMISPPSDAAPSSSSSDPELAFHTSDEDPEKPYFLLKKAKAKAKEMERQNRKAAIFKAAICRSR